MSKMWKPEDFWECAFCRERFDDFDPRIYDDKKTQPKCPNVSTQKH